MGMFNDFKYHNLGSLTEANFAGQKRGEESMTVDSNLATADVNRQNTLQQMTQRADLHPELVKQGGLRTVGMDLENEGRATGNKQKDLDLIKERMNLFVDKVGGGMDPVEAGDLYGIPPKAVEGWSRLTPEQRDEVAKKMSTGTQAARQATETETQRRQTQLDVEKERSARADATERERSRRALEVANIQASSRLKGMLANAANAGPKNANFQQELVNLTRQQAAMEQEYAAEKARGGMTEQRHAQFAGNLQMLEDRLQRIYAAAINTASAPAQARTAGDLQINPNGGPLTTREGPNPVLPNTGASNQSTAAPADPLGIR